jgi:hypothetical protein
MIPDLLYLDRYRNEGTRTYSSHSGYTEAEERYRPASPYPRFQLPVFSLPRDEVVLFRADPSPELLASYLHRDEVLFPVHPQILAREELDPYLKRLLAFGRSALHLEVVPSSSTRTVYVAGSKPFHALKLHFPFRVSRYGRKMREEVLEQATLVSMELQEAMDALGPDFAFQREVLGVALTPMELDSGRGENWGFLIREMTPFPPREGDGHLIPGFALFGADYHDSGILPLIVDLLDGRDPGAFLLEQIIFPMIRHWVTCFSSLGFMLEPHGQNVLLEMDSELQIQRVVYRDLNLGVDRRRRSDLGLPLPEGNTYNLMDTGAFASITFDMFMGAHFFDHLLKVLMSHRPGLEMETFRGPAREYFAQLFPEHTAYLPRTIHYFTEGRDRYGKPGHQDTGRAPVWRP